MFLLILRRPKAPAETHGAASLILEVGKKSCSLNGPHDDLTQNGTRNMQQANLIAGASRVMLTKVSGSVDLCWLLQD